ncbi:NUDIX domain-containing protein, partial [Candidatus Woesearchaeota archaeon]|nr:NUDIX domain-containing protein [Candidatus Woesearchaeota archaeon]
KDDKILLLKRTGSHGADTWSLPGGHLEMNEQIEECAVREVMEETNVTIANVRVVCFTNDIMKQEGKHYITIFVEAAHADGTACINEPDKSTDIGWFSWDNLPKPLFLPLKHFVEKKGYSRQ